MTKLTWLALPLAACTWTSVRPEMPARFQVADREAPQDVVATPQPVAPQSAPPTPIIEGVLADEEVAAMLAPELRIESLRGISAEQAGVMLAPVTESLEACRPRKRARLRVRIVADENGTAMHLDPKSRIDPKTKRCVLEALSVMEVEGALAQSATSGSDAPPRIESQLTINW